MVCLSGLIQAVVIARATVASLDTVRYVGIARQIGRVGFVETFQAEGEQPLFPLAIYLTHAELSAFVGEPPSLWAASAQVAAGVSMALAVIPVYFISRRLVGSGGGFVAGVFFCVLPEAARLGGDGISDSLHLLFFALSFWLLLKYLKPVASKVTAGSDCREVGECGPLAGLFLGLAAGLSGALAILTRAETSVLFAAIIVASVFGLFVAESRRRWKRHVVFGGGLALGVASVLGFYVYAAGPYDSCGAVGRVLGRWHPHSCDTASEFAANWQPADGRQIAFGVNEQGQSIRRRGLFPAMVQFGEELADVFGYVIGVLSMVGLLHMWRLRLFRMGEAECLLGTFVVLFSAVVVYFAAVEGYLNARHLLPLAVAGIGPAGFGAIALAHWLRRRMPNGLPVRPLPLVVVFFTAICLVTTLRPLHAGRIAHLRAGCWLAEAEQPGIVLDTKGWTGLYSARKTFQYDRARETFADPRLAYVVAQSEDLQTAGERGRTLRFLLDMAAEPAATFAGGDGCSYVSVYRWYPDRFLKNIVGRLSQASTAKPHTLINAEDS